MAFNDGDPIDAAVLTKLEERLAKAEADIPRVGAPGSTVPPQMYGGQSGMVTIAPGVDQTFTIDYSAANLSSNPTSIILTPVHPSIKKHIDFYVIESGSKIATCGAFISAATGATSVSTKFNYFVICN
jgi:hypothetical protein